MNPDPSALPNAVEQTAFLSDYSNTLWLGFWGSVGGTINLLLYMASGKPWNNPLALATVVSGAALAMTCGGVVGSWLGASVTQSMGITGCALITGMLGITIAKKIVGLDVVLPFGNKGTGQ